MARSTVIPWDQRIARALVRPLARTGITPNQITTVTLVFALAGAALFARGDAAAAGWGAGLFVLARFLDHFDGELGRLTGTSSRFGYYYDYVTGALSYAALFLGVGIGLRGVAVAGWVLGDWTLVLGLAGAMAAVIAMFSDLGVDRHEMGDGSYDAVRYPSFAGFELEDGIYLIAPITWLGFLPPFFVAAGVGATMYCLWTLARWRRARRATATDTPTTSLEPTPGRPDTTGSATGKRR
jgi:archaetidylinositol phosphate synthase